MNDMFTIIKHEKLSPEEREQTKELNRMHMGSEHAERSERSRLAWEFESEVQARLAEQAPVSVANDAAAMLREVMFWEIKAEHRDFWVWRVVKCHPKCDPDTKGNCCWHKVGLSRRNVNAARALLVALDLMEYTNGKGLPTGFHNRTHYRVNHVGVVEFLEKLLPADTSTVDEDSRYERTNSVGTNVHTLTENTRRENDRESTYTKGNENKTYSSLPPRGGGVGSHEAKQDYATSTREPNAPPHTPAPMAAPVPTPGRALAILVAAEVSKDGNGALIKTDFDRLTEEFDALHERGTPRDNLEAAAHRVASMYPEHPRVAVSYALRTVRLERRL